MFHSKGLNDKINRIHERALTITYNDKSSSYRELLTKDRSVTRIIRANFVEITFDLIYIILSSKNKGNSTE